MDQQLSQIILPSNIFVTSQLRPHPSQFYVPFNIYTETNIADELAINSTH